MKRFLHLLCISFIAIFVLSGCSIAEQDTEQKKDIVSQDGIVITHTENQTIAQLFAMDTFMQVTLYDATLSDETFFDIMKTVYTLESIFSATDESSELYQLNQKNTEWTVASETLCHVLSFAQSISAQTDGCLDITAYPLIRAWGFTEEAYRIPSATELETLRKTVHYQNVAIAENSVMLNGSKIDLGALVKGYTGDVLAAKLREHGVKKAVLSLGGNVIVIGEKSKNNCWTVAVRDPLDDTTYAGYLKVADTNVITSGGYERYFEGEDGEIYWHIIDPKTGYPAKNGILSVTVIGQNGMQCDALSTALFVMGEAEAISYYQNYDGFNFILITEDNRILITEGMAEHFTPYQPDADIIVIKK